MKPQTAKVPTYLRPSTAAWMRGVLRGYVLEPHHVHLLRLAAEALDRAEQAREGLLRDGLVVPGREGSKAHPLIAVERDSRLAYARLIRELCLDDPPPDSRPPSLRTRGRNFA